MTNDAVSLGDAEFTAKDIGPAFNDGHERLYKVSANKEMLGVFVSHKEEWAIDEAKSFSEALVIGGGKVKCDLATEGKHYGGKVLGLTDLHVVQNLGMNAVIHIKANLDRIPEKDEMVNINYAGGLGVVEPRNKSASLER